MDLEGKGLEKIVRSMQLVKVPDVSISNASVRDIINYISYLLSSLNGVDNPQFVQIPREVERLFRQPPRAISINERDLSLLVAIHRMANKIGLLFGVNREAFILAKEVTEMSDETLWVVDISEKESMVKCKITRRGGFSQFVIFRLKSLSND